MQHSEFSEAKKNKSRGRPIGSKNKRRKLENSMVDSSRSKIDNGREIIDFPEIEKEKNVNDLTKLNETKNEELKNNLINLELIDSIEFKNESNKLTIRFSKTNNRMFRIQIFLNDETEIRPVTYNGSSTSYTFWNLLKKALKPREKDPK